MTEIYVLFVSDSSESPYVGSSYRDKSDAVDAATKMVQKRGYDDDDIITHDGYESVTVETDDRSDRYYVKVYKSRLH